MTLIDKEIKCTHQLLQLVVCNDQLPVVDRDVGEAD